MNRHLFSNWRYVPSDYAEEISAAAERACSDGAVPPLEYQGIGATAVVVCDERAAFKIARSEEPIDFEVLRDEYEFMLAASKEPSISQHVARPFALHVAPLMIERECIETREYYGGGTSKQHDRRWETFQRIMSVMNQRGWCCTEYKDDSLVLHAKRGWVLVDGGFSARTGWALAQYVREIITGRRPIGVSDVYSPSFTAKTLAWQMRMDSQKGWLPKDVVQKLSAQLRARWPWDGD